jgi:hypothetical protein
MPALLTSRVALFAGLLALLAAFAPPANAQDTHYWTQQYGTTSELLGGAVVGGVPDISAVYYNPGQLSLFEDPSVLLSAKAVEVQTVRIEDGGDRDRDLSESRFGTAPSLFAGTLPSKWFGDRGQMAYSGLTRQEFDVRLKGSSADVALVVSPPTLVEYSSESVLDLGLSENWFGLSWSEPVREGVGLGASLFVVYRGQRNRTEILAQGRTAAGGAPSLVFVDDFDYWHYRLLAKIGLAVDRGRFTWGLAVTTPGVGLAGTGRASFRRSVVDVDLNGDGTPDPILASDFQDGLSVEYRSPWSIAGGVSGAVRRTRLHFSAEWFDAVGRYNVLDPSPFSDSLAGITLRRRLSHELQSVFNWGVGVEHSFNPSFGVSASFVADHTAAVPGTLTNHSLSDWDIYHVTGGTVASIQAMDLTLGVSYAFGGSDRQLVVGEDPEDLDSSLMPRPRLRVDYSRWKFIIGFAFTL